MKNSTFISHLIYVGKVLASIAIAVVSFHVFARIFWTIGYFINAGASYSYGEYIESNPLIVFFGMFPNDPMTILMTHFYALLIVMAAILVTAYFLYTVAYPIDVMFAPRKPKSETKEVEEPAAEDDCTDPICPCAVHRRGQTYLQGEWRCPCTDPDCKCVDHRGDQFDPVLMRWSWGYEIKLAVTR